MSPISVIITIAEPVEKPTMKVSSLVTVNRPGMLWHLP